MSRPAPPSTARTTSASSASSGGPSSLSVPVPPFPAYLTGGRLLIWDLPAAHLLRQRHRIVGECRGGAVQPARRNGAQQPAADGDEDDTAAAYTSAPVHYALPQAHWLLQHGLIGLLDGTDLAALRSVRFVRSGGDSGDARLISSEERRLYLIRYMQEANKAKQSKRAQHSKTLPPAAPPAAVTLAEQAATNDISAPLSQLPAPLSSYPAFSTHAIAEALLSEPSTSTAVPLSSLPVTILSHCSPPEPLPPSLSASPASARLRSMCAEPSTARLTRAFADLHSRGYVVTAGQQYGGDLLLYDGDPSASHAHSVVSIRSADQSPAAEPAISALDLLTAARIGSAVGKGVVLACEAAGSGQWAFLSVHWQASLSAVP